MLYYRLLTLLLLDSAFGLNKYALYSETLSINIDIFGLNKYALLSSTDTDIIRLGNSLGQHWHIWAKQVCFIIVY